MVGFRVWGFRGKVFRALGLRVQSLGIRAAGAGTQGLIKFLRF